MSAARKRLRVQHSDKADWKKEDWYVSNVKDCAGPYYVDVPIGKFSLNLIHMIHKICNIFCTSMNKKGTLSVNCRNWEKSDAEFLVYEHVISRKIEIFI